MKYLLFITILISCCTLQAQDLANTLELKEGEKSPKATLASLDFIAGQWKGNGLGGTTEEIWSPAMSGSMMGTFKMAVEGKIQFYEMMTITEEDGTLVLRLLHFDSKLVGWEEKGDALEFPLVKVTDGKVYFSGLTFEKKGRKKLNIYVVFKNGEKEKEEMKFSFKRKGKLKK